MSESLDQWYDDFRRRLDKAQQLNDAGYDEDDQPVTFPLRPKVKPPQERHDAGQETADADTHDRR